MNSLLLHQKIDQIRQYITEIRDITAGRPSQFPGQAMPLSHPGKSRGIPALLDESILELRSACELVARRRAISAISSEIWRSAARERISEEKLLKKLLPLAGSTLNLSRCAYYTLAKETGEGVCTVQWTRPETSLTVPSFLPRDIVKELVGERYLVVYEDPPAEPKQVAIAQLLAKYEVRSFLAVPSNDPALPNGFFTFWDCERPPRWTPAEIDQLMEIGHIIGLKSAQVTSEQALLDVKSKLEVQVRERTSELAGANRKLMEELADRDKALEQVQGEKTLLAFTLSNMNESVITLDAQQRIVLFNGSAEKLTGWSSVEAAGKPLNAVIDLFEEKNHSQRCVDFLCRCRAAAEKKIESRCMLRSRNGKEHIVSGQCIGGGDGEGTVLALRDITRSWLFEEELLKVRKLESVGVLATGIARDFDRLLTSITTYLFMARMSAIANEETDSLISEAEKATFKAATLTRQLLSIGTACPSVKEIVSLKELVQDTVGFCLSGATVDYRLDLPDDLLAVEIDRGQIDQVLGNLLANATQAMPDGGMVVVSGENVLIDPANGRYPPVPFPLAPGKYVKISISDEGTGIPFDQMPSIFDPYFTTKKSGTGLGLTVAYSIIRGHDGHLAAESTPGRGSVFSFYLPASARGGRRRTSDVSFQEKGSGKILIVYDDVAVHTVIESLLRKSGYVPVSVASTGQAVETYAASLLEEEPFAAVIIDIDLAGDAGTLDTVKQLRAIDRHVRVIALTGSGDDPVSPGREFGVDEVMTRPFSVDEFVKKFSSVLTRPRPDGKGMPAGSSME